MLSEFGEPVMDTKYGVVVWISDEMNWLMVGA